MIKLKNPITIFVFTWLLVLVLYNMRYSEVLTVLNTNTLIYILLSCLSLILAYLFTLTLVNKYRGKVSYVSSITLHKSLKVIFIIWVLFTLVEIAYFRSLPFLTFVGIGSSTYTEWGIPSLHGLLNAMIITISNYFFYLYITTKNKKYLWIFVLCLCWPILLVTRQVFMSMTIQAGLIYILVNKIKTATIFKISLSALAVIFLFGYVGDLRAGNSESFIALAQPSPSYPTFLPSGFLWVYIYITSPLNNINFNIDKYPAFNFNPLYIVSSFIPSFIRTKILKTDNEFNFKLVNEYLNVSSMFPDFLAAFGYWGSIGFYFILGMLFTFIYIKVKSKQVNIKWVFILTVILHDILFSVFVNFFSNLVFLFQIILHYIIGTKIKANNDKV